MSIRETMRERTAAAALVLLLVGLMIAVPIVIGSRDNNIAVETASLMAAPGNTVAISSPVALDGLPGLSVLKGTVSLDAAQAKAAGDEAGIAKLIASGTARLILDRAVISIDGPLLDVLEGDEVPPLLAALGQLKLDTLVLRRASVVVHRAGVRREVISDVSAEISNRRRTGLTFKGGFTARDEDFTVDGTLATAGSGSRRAMKATVKSGLMAASLDGMVGFGVAPEFRGRSDLIVTSAREVLRWLGFPWPAGPGLEQFRADGQLEWTGRSIAFQKAKLQLDGNVATGTLTVAAAGSRPSIEGTLAFETLDLTRYALLTGLTSLPTLTGDGAARRTSSATLEALRLEPGRELRLPFLKLADADVRISASKIRVAGLELRQGAASITLRGGRLEANIAEVQLGEAHGGGQITADANTAEPRYVIRGKLKGLELGAAVAPLLGRKAMNGVGDVSFDVSAYGTSAARLLATISGKVAVVAPDGARLGFDARALVPGAANTSDRGSWQALTRGQTTVDKLEARIVLNSGLAFADLIEAPMGNRVLQAAGSADLSAQTLDVKLSVADRKPALPAGAGSPAAPASVPTPAPSAQGTAVRLQGSWSDPRVVIGDPRDAPAPSTPAEAGVAEPG